ncbi:MAG: hypothetical protein FH756_10305 [Firmicutes bacterium]|nr:hypothetical protein [Bacillota bacterium]
MAKHENPLILLMQGFKELHDKQQAEQDSKGVKNEPVAYDNDKDKDKSPLDLLRKGYKNKE